MAKKKVMAEEGASKTFSLVPTSFQVPDDVIESMGTLADKSLLDAVNIVRYDLGAQNAPYFWRKIAEAGEDGVWKSTLLCDRHVEDYNDSFAAILQQAYVASGKDAGGLCYPTTSSAKHGKKNNIAICLENPKCSVFRPSLEDDSILEDETNLVELEFTFMYENNSIYVTATVPSSFHSRKDLFAYYRSLDFWANRDAQLKLFSCINSGASIHKTDGIADGLVLYRVPYRKNGSFQIVEKVFPICDSVAEKRGIKVFPELYWYLANIRIIGSDIDDACLPDMPSS